MNPPEQQRRGREPRPTGVADVEPYAPAAPSPVERSAAEPGWPGGRGVGAPSAAPGVAARAGDLLLAIGAVQIGLSVVEIGSPSALFEALVLWVAVWRLWTDGEAMRAVERAARRSVGRDSRVGWVELALGAAGLVAVLAAPEAFLERGAVFAAAVSAAAVGRWTAAAWWARAAPAALRRRALADLGLRLVSSAAWVSGAFAEPDIRLTIWAFAATLDLCAPRLTAALIDGRAAFARAAAAGASPSGGDAARRRDAVLAALAAAALVAAIRLGDVAWTGAVLASGAAILVRDATLLWLVFGRGAPIAASAAALGVVGAGLCAVADGVLTLEAGAPLTAWTAAVVVGGPSLTLLACGGGDAAHGAARGAALARRRRAQWFGPSRLGALGLCALGLAWPLLDAPTLALASAFVLVSTALWRGHAARGPLGARAQRRARPGAADSARSDGTAPPSTAAPRPASTGGLTTAQREETNGQG